MLMCQQHVCHFQSLKEDGTTSLGRGFHRYFLGKLVFRSVLYQQGLQGNFCLRCFKCFWLLRKSFVYSYVLLVCLGLPKGWVLLGLTCTVPSTGKWSTGNTKQTWNSFQHLGKVIAVELLSWFPWRWSLLTVFGTEACGKSSMLMCSINKRGWRTVFRLAVGVNFNAESEKQLDVPLLIFFFSKCQVPLAKKAGKYWSCI